MFPYWLMFTLFAAGAVQYPAHLNRRAQGGLLLLTAGILITIMVGLRYQVGGDWVHYLDLMKQARYLDFWDATWAEDPGYGALNWLATRAGLGIWSVNLVCAAIFGWGLMRFAGHQPSPWLALVVAVPYLIIVVAMGYTRQAVAMGFIFVGLTVLDRGMLRFAIYMTLAAAFHKSALVVLPFVALSPSQNRLWTIVIGLVSAALLYYLFVQASIDRLMTNYVESGYASSGAAIRVAMNMPPALLFLLFQKRFAVEETERRLWRNFSIAALVALVMLLFTNATTALDRLALYIIPLQIFVLSRAPAVFAHRDRPSLTLTLAIILYSAAIQFTWLNYADNATFWLPYQFYPTAEQEAVPI